MIEYAALTKLQVKDPQAYMRERQPQGTALATCFVAPHVVERAEAEVEEACGAGGAIDLAGCFSFPVTDADLDALAEASAPLAAAIAAKRVRALTPALLVSEKLLRDCEPALAAFVEQTAKQRHEARTAPKQGKAPAKGEAAGGEAAAAGKAGGRAGAGALGLGLRLGLGLG